MRISADDGCASDVRLAELCTKYGIDCVFYWPVEMRSLAYANDYKPLSHYDAQQIADNFTLGSHTITHRHLTKIPVSEAILEIVDSKSILESIYNVKITKFAPPRGYTSDELTKITLQEYESQRLTKGKNLVHVHPNSGANDEKHWLDAVTEGTDEIWLHTWELNRFPEEWNNLENYLASLA